MRLNRDGNFQLQGINLAVHSRSLHTVETALLWANPLFIYRELCKTSAVFLYGLFYKIFLPAELLLACPAGLVLLKCQKPQKYGHWPQCGFVAGSARSTQSWVTCWVQSRAQLFTSHGKLRGAVTDQTPHCFCKICRITRPGLCVKPWAQARQAASPLLPGLPV